MIRGIVSLFVLGTLVLGASCSSDPEDTSAGPDASAPADDDLGDDDTTPGKDAGRTDAASGSSSSGSSGSSGSSSGSLEAGAVVDYSVAGPSASTTASGTTDDSTCDVAYVRYKPTQGAAVATVILSHGLTGNVGDLDGLAEHLASWGLDVVATTLCTNNIANIDHTKNGKALSDLAGKLQLPAPLFAGFSAGGLAAYLAAGRTGNAAGFVGLDPVDADDLALGVAPIAPAVRAILTEPARCNSTGNFKEVLAEQANSKALRVTGASHYDALGASCSGISFGCNLCGPTGADRHRTVLAFATAALLELAGNAAAGGYFTPGSQPYDERLAAGTISVP